MVLIHGTVYSAAKSVFLHKWIVRSCFRENNVCWKSSFAAKWKIATKNFPGKALVCNLSVFSLHNWARYVAMLLFRPCRVYNVFKDNHCIGSSPRDCAICLGTLFLYINWNRMKFNRKNYLRRFLVRLWILAATYVPEIIARFGWSFTTVLYLEEMAVFIATLVMYKYW